MEKKFNFVYLTTNLIDGKKYVGDHSTDDLNCSRTKNYKGGGRPYFKRALEKYGKENFKREIIEFFPSKQEEFDAQEKYIIEYNTLFPNGYNISPKGGHFSKGSMSEETKRKISKANKNLKRSFEQNLKNKERNSGINNPNFGLKRTAETKKKMSIKQTGENNPMFGKHHNKEALDKIRIAAKRKLSENTKQKMRKPKSKKSKLNMIIAQRNRREKEKQFKAVQECHRFFAQ